MRRPSVVCFLRGLLPAFCLGVIAQAESGSPQADLPNSSAGKGGAAGAVNTTPPSGFDTSADRALAAMRAEAERRGIGGVAVIAYFEGSDPHSWSSKMSVVGRRKDPANANSPGANLLAIAYAKATEMADTLKDSGDAGRGKLVGELGWQGGVVRPWNHGYLIAAFSGAKSEEDVEVSKAGVAALQTQP